MSAPTTDVSSNLGFFISTGSNEEEFFKLDILDTVDENRKSDAKLPVTANPSDHGANSFENNRPRKKVSKRSEVQTPRSFSSPSLSRHDIVVNRRKRAPDTLVTISSDSDSEDCIIEKVAAPSSVVDGPKKKLHMSASHSRNSNYDSEVSSDDYLTFKETKNISLHLHASTPTQSKSKFAKQTRVPKGKPSIIYTDTTPVPRRKLSCTSFTPSMAAFYDSDVPGSFDINEVHSSQTGDPSKWKIVRDDLYPSKRRNFDRRVRCARCKDYGHLVNACPKVPHCRYCGESDHVNIRNCPMNCCLQCGGKPHYSCWKMGNDIYCNVCDNRGHDSELCPDLWRRFHVTTKGSIPIQTTKKNSMKVYCSNCSKRGHYGYQCKATGKNKKYVEPRRNIVSYSLPTKSRRKRKRDLSKEGAALKKMCIDLDPEKISSKDVAACVTLCNNGFLENDLDDRQSVEIQGDSRSQSKMRKLIQEKNRSMRGLTQVMQETINITQQKYGTSHSSTSKSSAKRKRSRKGKSKNKRSQVPTFFLP